MHPLLNIAITAGRAAGQVIMRGLENKDDIKVAEKQLNDFVSEIDLHAEQVIIDHIHKAYPQHAIIAEESGQQGEHEITWIIDPLDGTRNFLRGLPHFAVSIAVREGNKITHGIIYDPVRDELFHASRGEGARLNNRRLRVSNCITLDNALLATGFPYRNKPFFPTYMKTFEPIFMASSGIRRGGACSLDLAYVAAGRLDGYWEFGLKPWDIAAGALMIKEAGGLISDNEGGENYLNSGNVVCGNPKIFKAILQKLYPVFAKQNAKDSP